MTLSHPSRTVKFTYEDYLLFPNDGKRHEIIDGEHYMTPSPNAKHQTISFNLSRILGQYLKSRQVGRAFAAPFDVVLSPLDVVQPDLMFVSASRSSIITDLNIQGAPDLLVEIVSDTNRHTDEIVKRKLYEKYGVQEYWVIDPVVETVKVYRFEKQNYQRVAELSREAGDSLTTPILPGLGIPLQILFEE